MFEQSSAAPDVDSAYATVTASMARIAAASEAAGLVAVAELALQRREQGRARGLGPEECDEYTADEVGALLQMSRNVARARLFLPLDLFTRRPATLAALTSGQICPMRARRLSEGLAHVSPEVADGVEREALRRAPEQTPAQLTARLTRLVLRADADADERRARAAVRERRCSIRVIGDGTAMLSVIGRTELVVAAWERIDAAARGVVRGSTAETGLPAGRALDQTRADLLLGLLVGDPDSVSAAGVAVTIDVVAPAGTLLGGDEPGELVGYGPIPAHVVRELAEDASWRRWVTAADGTVVSRSTRRYRPSAAMVRLLRARDGTCRFPTCRRRASACDLDHVVPWPAGATDEANLVSLCRHHHRLKHRAGWTVRLSERGDLHWLTPSGVAHVSPAQSLVDIVPTDPAAVDSHRTASGAAVTGCPVDRSTDLDPDPPPF